MRLGIGSYAFRWALGTPAFTPAEPMTLSDLVDASADMELEVLQVADNAELEQAAGSRLAELGRQARARGVAWQTGFTGASSDKLEQHLRIAEGIGADVVRVVVTDDRPGSPEARAVENAAAAFESAGIRLGLENHGTAPTSRLVSLVEHVGSAAVGIVVDVANSILADERPQDTIRALAPYAVCLHLKDYRWEADADGVGGHLVGSPLGEGLTDVGATMAAVAPRDHDGSLAVILEQWVGRLPDEEATLRRERAWRESSVAHARAVMNGVPA